VTDNGPTPGWSGPARRRPLSLSVRPTSNDTNRPVPVCCRIRRRCLHWSVDAFAWLLWRELRFARSHGIALTAQTWRTEWPRLKRFRREDPQARRLYELVSKWLRITLLTWIIGFIVLGGALFILERAGMLVGPYSRSHG